MSHVDPAPSASSTSPVERLTAETAAQRYPDMRPHELRAIVPAATDAACPDCGARLCWGGATVLAYGPGTQSLREASAYCVLGGDSSLARGCTWKGTIHLWLSGRIETATVKCRRGEHA